MLLTANNKRFLKLTKERYGDDVITIGNKLHKGLDTYENTKYVDSNTKITVTCKKHGDYEISTGSYLTGGRCTPCGVESKQLSLSDLKIKIAKVHGDKYEYDWASYKNFSNNMKIKCSKHGWFSQRVNTHISGFGCRICGVDSRRYGSKQVLDVIKNHFRDRYTYNKFVYVRDGDPVIVTCKEHGDFSKVPNELVRGNGCTKCRESKPERDMGNILSDNNIDYVQEYKLDGKPCRYDVYLPKLNVLIELDGPRHYVPIEHWGGKENLARVKTRDRKKDMLAKCHNIPLIRIPYTEFNNLERVFFKELSNHYLYRVGDEFYREFKDLPIGTVLPKITTTLDAAKYLI